MSPYSVSVIIPCYNAEKTIRRALDSVYIQTQPVLEVLCVDDCSADRTVALIETFQTAHPDLPLKILRTARNHGPSIARNLGWDNAAGDYVAFLDADDAWHPQKIAIQFAWMRAHPTIDLCGHAHTVGLPTQLLDRASGEVKPRAFVIAPSNILLSNPFVTPSVMLKRALTERFEPTRRYTEDYLLWMQICLHGHPIVMLDAPLVFVLRDTGGERLSRHYLRMRAGDIQNYGQLWREKQISVFKILWLIPLSVLKFILLLTFPGAHSALKRRLFTKPLPEST
ncbi:MAG: glycosyltransferase family 2 protein [Chloroflexi bacterium]|nr:glycosyltransferase family 2 protein [Chloroflexota bacterium]